MKKLKAVYDRLFQNGKYAIIYLLLFVMYVFLMPNSGHGGDRFCWLEWTKYIFSNGLGSIYKSWTDYLPLYHYLLFVFAKFQGSIDAISQNINYLKVITLIFDFLGGFLLLRLIYDKFEDANKAVVYSLLLFFNISYFYNTLIWGQVDGMMTCLVFLAFFFALKQKVTLSLVFIVFSISFKLQSIIFFPLLGLMLLPSMVKQFSFKNLIIWIVTVVAVQTLIIMPFLLAGDISRLWKVIVGSVGKFPVVSMNAYNLWEWFVKGNLMEVKDNILFMGISYKKWGQLLFFSSSLIVLFPLIKNVYFLIKKKENGLPEKELFIIASLLPLLFFFFNTQMHERYSHPAILFLAGYAILYNRYLPFILGSIACFLNLEGVLQYFHLNNYGTLIFDRRFVSGIFFICILLLVYDLFFAPKNAKSKPGNVNFTDRP